MVFILSLKRCERCRWDAGTFPELKPTPVIWAKQTGWSTPGKADEVQMWRECTCVSCCLSTSALLLLLCLPFAACSEIVLFGRASYCALIVQERICQSRVSDRCVRCWFRVTLGMTLHMIGILSRRGGDVRNDHLDWSSSLNPEFFFSGPVKWLNETAVSRIQRMFFTSRL